MSCVTDRGGSIRSHQDFGMPSRLSFRLTLHLCIALMHMHHKRM